MNVRWKKLVVAITLWLAVELWLNFLGLDDLADYSEFIFEKPVIVKSLATFSLSREPNIKGVLEKATAHPSEFFLVAA